MNSEEDITIESTTRPPAHGLRMSCSSHATTDIGCKRLHNEDAYLASNSKGLWAVADGMGGHNAGDVASKTVIHNLDRVIISDTLEDSVDAIQAMVQSSNDELKDLASDIDDRASMGTTLAMLVARDQIGVVMWAGDSRVYRIRKDNLEMISFDHSVVNDLISKGLLDPREAEAHPDANMITRSIGINDAVEVESRKVSVIPGDRYIICSDGLTRYVNDEKMNLIASLEVSKDSKAASEALVKAALDSKTSDNVTVVVIDFIESGRGD